MFPLLAPFLSPHCLHFSPFSPCSLPLAASPPLAPISPPFIHFCSPSLLSHDSLFCALSLPAPCFLPFFSTFCFFTPLPPLTSVSLPPSCFSYLLIPLRHPSPLPTFLPLLTVMKLSAVPSSLQQGPGVWSRAAGAWLQVSRGGGLEAQTHGIE